MKPQNVFAKAEGFWNVARLAEACSVSTETLEFFAYAALAFAIPVFFHAQNQLAVGTVVNFMLFAAAFYVRSPAKIIAMSVLPSLGALAAGALFGGLTGFLVFFAPVIWLGNAALVLTAKYTRFALKWNYVQSAAAAIALKVTLLGGAALALYSLGLVPQLFLSAMSVIQLATASSAAVLFYAAYRARRSLQV